MEKIKRTFHFILSHPIGKRHVFKSIFRFLVWQAQCSLFSARFIIKPFLSPVRFYARKGLTGITGNIYTGLHEFYDMTFLLHFLRKEDTFFDVGANVGSYTLLAAGVCGAKSVAIEPVETTFNILQKNITLNKLAPIVNLINAAVGAQKGVIKFSTDNDAMNHVIAQNEEKEQFAMVDVVTIDSLLADNEPTLIKIDVEGYETVVLQGMEKTLTLSSLKAIIIELSGSGARYGFDESKINSLMLSAGFNLCKYDPFKRSLTQEPRHEHYNTLYCRDIEFINTRLKNAAPINIMGEHI